MSFLAAELGERAVGIINCKKMKHLGHKEKGSLPRRMVILYKFHTIAQDSKLYADLSIVNRMGEPVAFECAANLNLFNTFTQAGLFFCLFVAQ